MIAGECIEFSVAMPNQPGTMAALSRALTESGVSTKAFMLYTSYVVQIPENPMVAGTCKLVTDDAERTHQALEKLGLRFRQKKALLLTTPKRTDVLPIILDKLAAAGLNLVDAYGVFPSDRTELLVVLTVSDEAKGFEIASQLDWTIR